jgi:sugar transferase (PEP-CTERM/EpsH1 system associated)
MKNLLYLVHRLPYPPNKGDKITSFNILKHLSTRYNVYLGCFIDDHQDRKYVPKVEKYCAGLCAVHLNPFYRKVLSLQGLLTNEALSLPFYKSNKLQDWVDNLIQTQNIDGVFILSGAMAQFVSAHLNSISRAVLDLEDVDSDKWQLYAKDHKWPLSWIFQRESKKLLEYERKMANLFDVTLFVSDEEAKLFKAMAPEVAHKIRYRVQGVDGKYFDPALKFESPYEDGIKVLVFTGAMDYWPNEDAVTWFAKQIMPRISQVVPNARFFIVGMNPARKVRILAKNSSIIVTGGVADVRPYLAHAIAAALPLRVARGIQNKILEAMAMEMSVLATPEAIFGIEPCPGFSPLIADTADELADKAIRLLTGKKQETISSRPCVLEKYNWDDNLQLLDELLDEDLSDTQTPIHKS